MTSAKSKKVRISRNRRLVVSSDASRAHAIGKGSGDELLSASLLSARSLRVPALDGRQGPSQRRHLFEPGPRRLLLIGALALWLVVLVGLGLQGVHEALAAWPAAPQVLWQAVVPVAIVMLALFVPSLRQAVAILGDVTPWRALIAIQALRIGAIGGVVKGLRGDLSSSFLLWVGIPDFMFGVSALLVAALYSSGRIEHRFSFLAVWSLVGAAIILVPTFGFMPYWMHERGFAFIFEFPMVLAPGIVVPSLVLLNSLLAWRSFVAGRSGRPLPAGKAS